jgi:hypothetical protein
MNQSSHGFWDYTTPGAGGMEGYDSHDFDLLLEDMCEAGMRSVVVMAKWLTTGYRSRLPFLDQQADNLVIASGNRLLTRFLDRASKAGIETWIGAVVTMYPANSVPAEPLSIAQEISGTPLPFPVGTYDADTPQVCENGVAVMRELAEQFPMAGGLLVEMECSDRLMPHRIPRYDAWAAENGRPRFADLTRKISACNPDLSPWRDYTTSRRIAIVCEIEDSLRAAGYKGRLATICEVGYLDLEVVAEVNLRAFKAACPDWLLVAYHSNYLKTRSRLGVMELAVEEPKRAGFACSYLPRGVMTWADAWPLEIPLDRYWEMELEDIERFRPDYAWWFGSGTGSVAEGAHVSRTRLRDAGFVDGRAARRALLAKIRGKFGNGT